MVLVFGKNGQVARALAKIAPDYLYLSSQEAPFTASDRLLALLNEHHPQCVVNAAAYTAVDKAETERDLAWTINAEAPGVIAQWCAENHVPLIHYSTDYVFAGTGDKPWLEDSPVDPVNWYGATKLEGEERILASQAAAYIFRISWVYHEVGNNFPNTIRRLAKERKELKIVADQWGAPTNARDVAQTTHRLVTQLLKKDSKAPAPGLYHLRFEDYTNWYQFALQIIEKARSEGSPLAVEKVIPISSEEFPTPAQRPKNSRLGTHYPSAF